MVQEFHISTYSLLVRCKLQAHSSSRGLHQFPHITTELVAAHDTVQQSPILQRMKSLNTLHVLRVHNICTYIYWQALLMSLWDPFYDFWLLFSVADKESKVTKILWEGRHSCFSPFEMLFTSSHSTSAVPLLWHWTYSSLCCHCLRSFVYLIPT